MFTVKTGAEFLEDLRALDERVKNMRISSIEIDKEKSSITYKFIHDKTIDDELKERILKEASKITSLVFKKVDASFFKVVANPDLINVEIYKYINANYPSLSIFLKQTDISSTVKEEGCYYKLRLTLDGATYVNKNGTVQKLNGYLATKFCSDFVGSIDIKESEELIDLTNKEVFESELQKVQLRTIKVENVVVIDDKNVGDTATYIEDAVSGEMVVCGIISEIVEKQTKTGKPFFILRIDDTTSRLSGLYFAKKSTVEHIRLIKEGDAIIARGTMGEYNGRPSFTFEKINRCTFPQGFRKEDKFKKPIPVEYKVVFPEKASTIKVESVFDSEGDLPKELTEKEYVVFDIETTGIDVKNNSITEIGAVKIRGGKIVEQFTTLIKPDHPITDEIVKLTGITAEMVKDSPKISTVFPDFMKFIENTTVVAHNADFDTGYIRKYAEAEEYSFLNPIIDTMILLRRYVPSLKHSDLHTMADYFGIAFHHHRALSDAYATAECFIRLMKLKNK